MGFDEKLKQMNGLYKDGKDKLPGVPDGQYTCQLQAAYLAESKASGNLMVKREHLVIEGEHSGEVIYDQIVLHSEQSAYWLNKWIVSMGYEGGLDDLQALTPLLKDMTRKAPIYAAIVKLSGEFRNVRVKELISDTSNDTVGEDPDSDNEDNETGGGSDFPESGPQEGQVIKYMNEGVESQGKVIAFDKDSKSYHVADIDDPDSVWAVSVEAIIGDEPFDDDEQGNLVIMALDLANSHDLGGVMGDSLETLTQLLKGKIWVRSELVEDEVASLEALEIPIRDKPKPVPKPVKPQPKPVAKKPASKPQGKPQGSKPKPKPAVKGKK